MIEVIEVIVDFFVMVDNSNCRLLFCTIQTGKNIAFAYNDPSSTLSSIMELLTLKPILERMRASTAPRPKTLT